MGLEDVKHDIIANAEQEAKKIVTKAKELVKKEFESAHQIVDSFEIDVQESLQKELATLEKRSAAHMQLTAKKIFLQKRRELLDTVVQETKQVIAALSVQEKKKIYRALFSKAKKQCTIGRIFCTKQDAVIVKRFFPHIKYTEMIGGIIVENNEGTLRIDYSFDSLLHNVQEKKLQNIANLLFSNK